MVGTDESLIIDSIYWHLLSFFFEKFEKKGAC